MGWLSDIVATPSQELAERHGAPLLASQLQSVCRDRLDDMERHAAEVRALKSQLSDMERIGLAVMRAERQGRKTVRIADVVTTAAPSA